MIQKTVNLDTDIQFLKGVGPKLSEKLKKLDIEQVSDLIFHFPRGYKDYTKISKISDLMNNDQFPISNQLNNDSISQYKTIKVKIIGIENKRTSRRRFTVTEAVVADDSGTLQVVWFNQPYLSKMLKPGSELLLNGSVTFNRYSNSYVMESPDRAKKPSIVPVYPETKGVSSYYIAKLVKSIKSKVESLEEFLPAKTLKEYDLMDYSQAIWQMHAPENGAKLKKAKERLAFDELFFVALRARINKEELKGVVAPALSATDSQMKKFVDSLPFKLTNDQKKAAWIIARDLSGQRKLKVKSEKLKAKEKITIGPMNRLLNGDVGSGKTVVAAFAIFIAYKAGYKSILMAPTQILANQHFETLKNTLEPFGIKIALITSDSKKNYSLPSTHYHLIVGTQAILHLKEKVEDVGLVIVDEQHRFGVKQRAAIKKMTQCHPRSGRGSKNSLVDSRLDPKGLPRGGNDKKVSPHFLSMTATPIPRTLYLSLFSDLDISIIKEMPKGRKAIKTKFVGEENRTKAYQFIQKQIELGQQVFVICPLIEEQGNDSHSALGAESTNSGSPTRSGMTIKGLFDIDKKSVVAEYEKLDKKVFPKLKIGMLHGKMKGKEKDEIMAKFSNKRLDILVSTSIVEVGVDIPNATVMMIEGAEYFGLAQLHQFRGRVGRGEHQSFCFVFSGSQNPNSISRLKSFENITDGFKLAEIDLKNRGAGQVFGKIQSGHFDFIHADISDKILVSYATEAAKKLVNEGVDKYPQTKVKLEEIENTRHLK